VTEVIIRPERGKKAYRLRCRFRVEAHPSERWLEKAKYRAAEEFVRDMAKQGWEYLSKHGFKMTGPYPAIETVRLPKASQQPQWHIPSRDMLEAIQAGYRLNPPPDEGGYAKTVPLIDETDKWEYELAGVFLREKILSEVPDKHEESFT